METEVLAFGRLPPAFSARCFTARHYWLNKDECKFRCLEHPDGLLLSSIERQPFLVLNGTQTQSAAQQCLIDEAAALIEAGVSRLRLSPCSRRFEEVLDPGCAAQHHQPPASSYLCLLLGEDDADQMFFERVLVMEGDTELGLVLKNALDAIGPLLHMPGGKR